LVIYNIINAERVINLIGIKDKKILFYTIYFYGYIFNLFIFQSGNIYRAVKLKKLFNIDISSFVIKFLEVIFLSFMVLLSIIVFKNLDIYLSMIISLIILLVVLYNYGLYTLILTYMSIGFQWLSISLILKDTTEETFYAIFYYLLTMQIPIIGNFIGLQELILYIGNGELNLGLSTLILIIAKLTQLTSVLIILFYLQIYKKLIVEK